MKSFNTYLLSFLNWKKFKMLDWDSIRQQSTQFTCVSNFHISAEKATNLRFHDETASYVTNTNTYARIVASDFFLYHSYGNFPEGKQKLLKSFQKNLLCYRHFLNRYGKVKIASRNFFDYLASLWFDQSCFVLQQAFRLWFAKPEVLFQAFKQSALFPWTILILNTGAKRASWDLRYNTIRIKRNEKCWKKK